MKTKISSVPRWTVKPKPEPADDTVYLTEKGFRVRIQGERDPYIGQKVVEVASGHWWYYRGILKKED